MTGDELPGTITGPANAAPDSPQRNRPRFDDLPIPDDTANLREGPDLHELCVGLLPLVGVWRGTGEVVYPTIDGPYTFGPIDYPDTYSSSTAFIAHNRTFVRDPAAPHTPSKFEWYCLECSFRPCADTGEPSTLERSREEASMDLTTVTYTSGEGIARIVLNRPAQLNAISPALRSSSNASSATACSTRDRPSTSLSKSKTRRSERSPRNRSRNCDTGGKRSAMCPSETVGGGDARRRIAAPSAAGS